MQHVAILNRYWISSDTYDFGVQGCAHIGGQFIDGVEVAFELAIEIDCAVGVEVPEPMGVDDATGEHHGQHLAMAARGALACWAFTLKSSGEIGGLKFAINEFADAIVGVVALIDLGFA